jgi:NADPH2:quinone reductase
VNRLLLHNQSLIGVNLGISPDGFEVRFTRGLQLSWDEIKPLLRDGTIKPYIGMELPLESAPEALNVLDQRSCLGKIVLRVR